MTDQTYSPQVRRSFLGKPRTFSLTLAEARLIEHEMEMGLLFMEALFRQRICQIKHIETILRYGLIGGGTDEDEVENLIKEGFRAGMILRYIDLCHEIICAFLGDMEDLTGDEAVQEEAKATPKKKPATSRKKASS